MRDTLSPVIWKVIRYPAFSIVFKSHPSLAVTDLDTSISYVFSLFILPDKILISPMQSYVIVHFR